MLKMLIAVDGSEHARRALAAAARLVQEAPQSEVVLLHVRDTPVYYGELPAFNYDALDDASREQQRELLEAALVEARACGLTQVETQAEVGLPAAEIARVAAARGVDLIVMGTHGRNALAGLVLGSVAQRVVHLTSVPVLLVK